jgi:prephenate dehydratase
VGESLAALHRVSDDVRFLGSYPRADDRKNRPAPDTAEDAAFADADAWLGRVRAGEAV